MDTRSRIGELLSEQLFREIVEIRRHLHRFPEPSFREHQTSAFIRGLLSDWGIPFRFPIVETGILARIEGTRPGPCIALRADMDALPVTERTGLSYQSENPGYMHACGHDVHMAALLGAIRLLDKMREQITGEILFIFQPGEEKVPGGARLMLEQGIFSERTPDVIIAQHVQPDMAAGQVGFRPGIYMASSDEIYIDVKGKGGHAAIPRQIHDPLLMASHILLALQHEVQRKAPAGIPTVLSFGKMAADGAVNVIPDLVHLEGTFRTMDEPWREEAHTLIRRVAESISAGMGGGASVEIRHGYPVLVNHEMLTGDARKKAVELLGAEHVEDLDIRMTAEDFAWFARTIPGMLYRLGTGIPGAGDFHPLHTPGFMVDEESLRTGMSMLAFLAVELLPPALTYKDNK